jgi:uncharacterized protein
MHRLVSWLILVAALYVSAAVCATFDNARIDIAPLPPENARIDITPLPPEKVPAPNIALLLPLKSEIFGAAASAVERGFMAAANARPHDLPVRVYSSADESRDIASLYQQAVANGARAVAGPLTRDGVAALATLPEISVPTLALNIAETGGADKLYFFSLAADAEAREVARLAAATGLHDAVIISTGTPLSRREAQAFAAEWQAQSGTVSAQMLFDGDPGKFADVAAKEGRMVFLAADAEQAHLIRPYLNIALPVYATSQVFNGNSNTLTNYDLKDVRFVDMPWLLQSDHPAVMVYPRPNPPLGPSMERLYALGIDAYRLLQIMLDNSYSTTLPLDGVTGRIHLASNHQFQRVAIPGIFRQGLGLTPEAAAALVAAQAAAARAAAASAVSAASAVPAAAAVAP